ncbi:MAG: haloacid dehalogenase-like hydrolase [Scytonema sp. PMC 1069.18]|nr:haloacid dehalogenase-like hydrolase [Scytonema sp. PMC 1069.18]MEC4882976.1 haloacid dehalogenase-like hydrolase [Scytonema sp. PMC 1070.18]
MTIDEAKIYKHPESDASEVLDFIKENPQESLMILDFDETLLLRNSTEEFLNTLQPRTIAAIILIILDVIKPWKLLPQKIGGETSRDWIRVLILTVLFPWNILLWRNHAQKLAHTYINNGLVKSIISRPTSRVVIATKGFDFIVRPITKHLPLTIEHLIACRFWMGCIDRNRKKEDLIASRISLNEIEQSIVVTDSLDDASLLAIVKNPFLVKWEKAKYIPAMEDAYIPFFYLEKVKRPGKKTLKNIIFKNHFVSLLLALSWLSPVPILHAPGIAFLLLSFWCIYEIGYYENDRVAEKFEQKPVLSEIYQKYKSKMSQWQPWVWAMILSILGIFFIEASQIDIWKSNHLAISQMFVSLNIRELLTQLFLWLSVLVSTRLIYIAYNYLDEKTRIWIYPILQFCKFFGFLVVTATNFVGVALLFAQLLVEWIPYTIYRCGGERHSFKEQTFRLFVYTFLCMTIALGIRDVSILMNPQFFTIFAWCLLRSRPELTTLFQNSHFIWKGASK